MDNWYVFIDTAHSPYMNMAIDELLLEESYNQNIPILRFYTWDRPSISIGYIQKRNAIDSDKYTVVRRPTGGGIVYHDIDFTYTIAIPKNHYIEKLSREESYFIFHKPITEILENFNISSELVNETTVIKDRMTMSCFSAPVKFDIASVSNNGVSKVAGAAQRRTRYGILHQGSIVIPDIEAIRNNLCKDFISVFEKNFSIKFFEYKMEDLFKQKAVELALNKYSQESWNSMR